MENTKFVAFEAYCKLCKYADLNGWEDPCNDCIAVGARIGTQKPEKFEKKEEE